MMARHGMGTRNAQHQKPAIRNSNASGMAVVNCSAQRVRIQTDRIGEKSKRNSNPIPVKKIKTDFTGEN